MTRPRFQTSDWSSSSLAAIWRSPPTPQVALTLRTLGGLTTTEIAHAFLVPEARWLSDWYGRSARSRPLGSRFEYLLHTLLSDRLAAVLAVVYLIFNEGYGGAARWRRGSGSGGPSSS